MAESKKISELPASANVSDADLIPGVPGGTGETSSYTILQIKNAVSAEVKIVKISLTSAQILSCFTSPITAIAAPGAGKAIQMLKASCRTNYLTAYATEANLNVICDTANNPQIQLENVFTTTTANRIINGIEFGNSTTNIQLVANKAILLQGASANPTGGTSTVDVYLTYRIITL